MSRRLNSGRARSRHGSATLSNGRSCHVKLALERTGSRLRLPRPARFRRLSRKLRIDDSIDQRGATIDHRRAAFDVQLGEYSPDVGSHRPLADFQAVSDVLVGEPLRDQDGDLELPARQAPAQFVVREDFVGLAPVRSFGDDEADSAYLDPADLQAWRV